ncbi:MAG: class I SAM-dependent methyltransferase [Eubacteriales bacterium]|nr:class I SAM-dependent methyltransferase [Eubacteriales bacterium]
MDFRKVFNAIPEAFDQQRSRYCETLFRDLIACAQLDSGKAALEIGPGTGQATEPVLQTGCDYLAIELGAPFTAFMQKRFSSYSNFHIVNADFETHDFAGQTFDLVYSAAAMQWIPEAVGFGRTARLLRPGGVFAMLYTLTDQQSADEALYADIDAAYRAFFRPAPEATYRCKLRYENVTRYGFAPLTRREYPSERVLSADEYIAWISTHADHILLEEPGRTRFFTAIRQAIERHGGRITLRDTAVLLLTRKEENAHDGTD